MNWPIWLCFFAIFIGVLNAEWYGSPLLSGGPSTLHPIAYEPALLVGLDRQKRELFLELWRSSVGGLPE